MPDRKQEIAWLNRTLREIQSKHDICPVCRQRPAKPETEVCQRCEDDAQANVVDLDADHIKAWGGTR